MKFKVGDLTIVKRNIITDIRYHNIVLEVKPNFYKVKNLEENRIYVYGDNSQFSVGVYEDTFELDKQSIWNNEIKEICETNG